MRGHVYYNGEEVEAEVYTKPPEPPEPISDERFSEICKVARTFLVCAAAVAAIWLAGTPAVMATGILVFFYFVFTMID